MNDWESMFERMFLNFLLFVALITGSVGVGIFILGWVMGNG